jgi:hypothetical protein
MLIVKARADMMEVAVAAAPTSGCVAPALVSRDEIT